MNYSNIPNMLFLEVHTKVSIRLRLILHNEVNESKLVKMRQCGAIPSLIRFVFQLLILSYEAYQCATSLGISSKNISYKSLIDQPTRKFLTSQICRVKDLWKMLCFKGTGYSIRNLYFVILLTSLSTKVNFDKYQTGRIRVK